MKRLVEPELLDELAPGDPLAVESRRDLRRINRVMGHVRILAGLLPAAPAVATEPPRIVELGAGDGTGLLNLARALSPHWPAARVVLVDRAPSVASETTAGFAALGWSVEIAAADVFDWLRTPHQPPVELMLANLFLHHFTGPRLAELLSLAAARTHWFAACEPRRSRTALAFSHLVGLIGCNAVTRHDAVVSVRAGFRNRELSDLWPPVPVWRLQEHGAGLFTHAFMAERVGRTDSKL